MATQYGEDIAVLKDQMKDVKDALIRIEAKQDAALSTFATKQELKNFKWITVPMVIILTAVLSALVIFYLSHGNTLTPETTINNTPSGSSGSSGTTPSANASATSRSDTATPSDSQTSSSTGGLVNTLKNQTGL